MATRAYCTPENINDRNVRRAATRLGPCVALFPPYSSRRAPRHTAALVRPAVLPVCPFRPRDGRARTRRRTCSRRRSVGWVTRARTRRRHDSVRSRTLTWPSDRAGPAGDGRQRVRATASSTVVRVRLRERYARRGHDDGGKQTFTRRSHDGFAETVAFDRTSYVLCPRRIRHVSRRTPVSRKHNTSLSFVGRNAKKRVFCRKRLSV